MTKRSTPRSSPIAYSEEMADRVVDGIMAGKSLRVVCAPADMPNKATVLRWVAKHPEFGALYAVAMEAKAECYADDTVDIADTAAERGEDPQITKVRVSTRQWMAERLKPKRYGSKVVQEHQGAGGGPMVLRWAVAGEGTPDPSDSQ